MVAKANTAICTRVDSHTSPIHLESTTSRTMDPRHKAEEGDAGVVVQQTLAL